MIEWDGPGLADSNGNPMLNGWDDGNPRINDEEDARAIAALPDWIARADRLEALLREARGYWPHPSNGAGWWRLVERIDAELHGGDPTPPADDSGHSRGHSKEGDD